MKIVDIRELETLKYLKGYGIDYTTRQGGNGYWEIVSRAGIERLRDELENGTVYTDGAMIVACDVDKEHVVMLREYRVSAGKYVYMFPAGLVEPGEAIETASMREFKEETGLDLDVVSVSPARYVSVGIVNERVNVAYGVYSGTPSKDYQTEHEEADILFVDKKEAVRILSEEEVSIRSALILESLYKLNPFVEEMRSKSV